MLDFIAYNCSHCVSLVESKDVPFRMSQRDGSVRCAGSRTITGNPRSTCLPDYLLSACNANDRKFLEACLVPRQWVLWDVHSSVCVSPSLIHPLTVSGILLRSPFSQITWCATFLNCSALSKSFLHIVKQQFVLHTKPWQWPY